MHDKPNSSAKSYIAKNMQTQLTNYGDRKSLSICLLS